MDDRVFFVPHHLSTLYFESGYKAMRISITLREKISLDISHYLKKDVMYILNIKCED